MVIHLTALVGGVLWGVIGALALGGFFSDTSGPATWSPAVVSSAVVFGAGVIAFMSARTITVRSVGIAAMVGALSGWYVLACALATGWW